MRYVSIALAAGLPCPECGRIIRRRERAALAHDYADPCCSVECAHEADYREWSNTDAGEAELAALAAVDALLRRAA